jgi:hypothetical protein
VRIWLRFENENVSKKDFNLLWLGKYILKTHLSKIDLDYMIPKGIGQASIPNI